MGAAAPAAFYVGESSATAWNTSYNKALPRLSSLAGTEGESPHSLQISQGTDSGTLLRVFIQTMNSNKNFNWDSEK